MRDMATVKQGQVQSYTHFLRRDKLYDGEKPYSLRFTPASGFPRANIMLDRREINIHDIRAEKDQLSCDSHGCFVWDFSSRMTYGDFDDKAKVRDVYLGEVADALRDRLGADKVQVFEHTVQRATGHNWRVEG